MLQFNKRKKKLFSHNVINYVFQHINDAQIMFSFLHMHQFMPAKSAKTPTGLLQLLVKSYLFVLF